MTDAATPQVQFLTDKPRVAAVTLDWPLAVDDVEYRVIYVKRMTTREVSAFVEFLRSAPDGAAVRFPIFIDANGASIPDAIWDALDSDDTERLNEVATGFLPARFRGATAPSSAPPAGATTGASSATSPTPSPAG